MFKIIFTAISKIILFVFYLLAAFVLVLMNGAVWIRLDPPASALLTVPKLLYPNVVNKAVIIYAILFILIIGVLALVYLKIILISSLNKWSLAIFSVILVFCLSSSFLFMNKINNAQTVFSYQNVPPVSNSPAAETNMQNRVVLDLSDEFSGDDKPGVFKLYLPDNSKEPRNVILYLAYGNWLATPEKSADYLVDALTEHGYGAVVFTGKTRLDTDFIGMVKDIREKVAYLRSRSKEYGIGRIILSGGSAGANLALSTAYAASCREFDMEGLMPASTKVDGVIGFYPVVDMFCNYDFFTKKTDAEKSIADKLGDAFFSLQDVNGANSIAQSHEIVMKSLLGGSPKDKNLQRIYEISSPTCFISADVPPTLLIQGEHDSMTPIEPTRRMYLKLKDAGAKAALLELPYTDHAFDTIMPKDSVVTRKVLNSIFSWLEIYYK